VVESGVADHAAEAVDRVDAVVGANAVLAVAVDAPLSWAAGGDRHSDQRLRSAIGGFGAPSSTVQHVNSLRGACLVQGIVSVILLRGRRPMLCASEAHPKATLWLLKLARVGLAPHSVGIQDLGSVLTPPRRLKSGEREREHERDAAVAALSAWAMHHEPDGWEDLSPWDVANISPLEPRPTYWMPQLSGTRSLVPQGDARKRLRGASRKRGDIV
jgi:hypothetical protein